MRFIARRVLTSLALLVMTSILIFVVLRALPGDPVLARLGASPGITDDDIARLRGQLGLDQPLVTQYGVWVAGMLHGDFGTSYTNDVPVATLLAQRVGPTLELTVLSVVLSVLVAVPAAILATRRPGGLLDRTLTLASSAGMAFPPFIAGILLILLFSIRLRVLPARGFVAFGTDPLDNLKHVILPTLALTIAAAPLVFRHLRGTLGEAVLSPFVRTVSGKGASAQRVMLRHALPNAALPSLTMVGLIFGYTLGGSVIVEYAFGISGLGSLSVESAFNRNYSVLQSVVLLAAALFILITLLVDLTSHRLDPRMRSSRG